MKPSLSRLLDVSGAVFFLLAAVVSAAGFGNFILAAGFVVGMLAFAYSLYIGRLWEMGELENWSNQWVGLLVLIVVSGLTLIAGLI